MKRGQAVGIDEAPAVFWKALLEDREHPVVPRVLELSNWFGFDVELPHDWYV